MTDVSVETCFQSRKALSFFLKSSEACCQEDPYVAGYAYVVL